MVGMGYTREEVTESLTRMKYDEITATYLLLGRKSTEVRTDWASGPIPNCPPSPALSGC